MRQGCIYTLVIINITEQAMDGEEKLYFCFGDELIEPNFNSKLQSEHQSQLIDQ